MSSSGLLFSIQWRKFILLPARMNLIGIWPVSRITSLKSGMVLIDIILKTTMMSNIHTVLTPGGQAMNYVRKGTYYCRPDIELLRTITSYLYV